MEITTVIPRKLYLGDIVNAKDEALLSKLKITHVINLSHAGPVVVGQKRQISWFPIEDGPGNKQEKFNEILEKMNEIMALEDSVLLVHCRIGMSRSPTVVATWFAKDQGITFDSAVDIITKMRPIVQPHFALRHLARAYLGEKEEWITFPT